MSREETKELNEVVRSYLAQYPNQSFSSLARTIQAENELAKGISVRSLRRKLAQFKSTPPTTSANLENVKRVLNTAGNLKVEAQSTGLRVLTLDEVLADLSVDLTKYFCAAFWPRVLYDQEDIDQENTDPRIKGYRYSIHLVSIKTIAEKRQEAKLQQTNFSDIAKRLTTTPPVSKLENTRWTGRAMMATIADMHTGARTGATALSEGYSYDKLIVMVDRMAEEINKFQSKEVHLHFVGDMIHSFTGVNHAMSWTELEPDGQGYGAGVVKMTHLVIKRILDSVVNLKSVKIVPGNHDRFGKKKDDDPLGGIAAILHYMVQLSHPDLEVEYDPLVISTVIDNIQYLSDHGHLGISKRPPSDIILEYGEHKKGRFYHFSRGHLHNLKIKDYYSVDRNQVSSKSYASVVVPSLYPGGTYEVQNHWGCGSGFAIFRRSEYVNIPETIIIPLG